MSKAHEIQKELSKKKEELYNLLAKVELKPYLRDNREFDIIDRYQNKKLLQQLSVQIEPRHNDIDWRRFQLVHKIHFYRIYGMSIVAGYMFWYYAFVERMAAKIQTDRRQLWERLKMEATSLGMIMNSSCK